MKVFSPYNGRCDEACPRCYGRTRLGVRTQTFNGIAHQSLPCATRAADLNEGLAQLAATRELLARIENA